MTKPIFPITDAPPRSHYTGVRCADCNAWARLSPNATFGECRRNPPKALVMPSPTPEVFGCVWPNTPEEGWCLEAIPREREGSA